MEPIRLVILGATGSIGRSAFGVWEEHREKIAIEGLVAHQGGKRLWELGVTMQAPWIALTDEYAARELKREVRGVAGPNIISGAGAMMEALRDTPATHVLAAMSGFAGLRPTLVALEKGMRVLLANKETLVAAGDLVRQVARQYHGQIVPVDSEHSAIYQCLGMAQPFQRIILTCSGGPFRGRTAAELAKVSVEEALQHPNWSMGPKITVDSATLMNKGLEVIEAHHLFEVDYALIDVVIHPESVIHSMVEFVDGSTMAQCGYPDMRVPIEVALAWPERWPLGVPRIDWRQQALHFEEPDTDTFRALDLARSAGLAGGLYPAVLNAANEAAVAAFLQRRIAFLSIADMVEQTLNAFNPQGTPNDLTGILEVDGWARRQVDKFIHASG